MFIVPVPDSFEKTGLRIVIYITYKERRRLG
jgi:hypothetical protein